MSAIHEFSLVILAPGTDEPVPTAQIERLFQSANAIVVRNSAQILNQESLRSIVAELIGQQDRRRPKVVVCGRNVEEQVSVCALRLLAEGFEVFLLRDLVRCRDPVPVEVGAMRLFQAGVVLTTQREMVYEWLSCEENGELVGSLNDLLSNILLEQ